MKQMRLKLILPLVGILFLFGCQCDTSVQDNKIKLLETQLEKASNDLNTCNADLEVSKAGFNDCILTTDTLKEQISVLEFKITNCEATIEANNTYHQIIISEKNDSINSLKTALAKKSSSYDQLLANHNELSKLYNELSALHAELLQNNHITDKEIAQNKLSEVQAKIKESEQAYHLVTTIEPPTPEALEALEAIKALLNYNYGVRYAIGDILGIQVDNSNILTKN